MPLEKCESNVKATRTVNLHRKHARSNAKQKIRVENPHLFFFLYFVSYRGETQDTRQNILPTNAFSYGYALPMPLILISRLFASLLFLREYESGVSAAKGITRSDLEYVGITIVPTYNRFGCEDTQIRCPCTMNPIVSAYTTVKQRV